MPPQVFAKVNAHYTRVVEERPLYKQLSSAMSRPPPPERSKQATLFDLFRGASTSREHDADHDSQSVTEAADNRTNGDSESLSSSASDF